MDDKKEERRLSSRQLRYLRGLGHHLKPLVMLGREGVSANFLNATNAVLTAHELIKIKVGNSCPLDRWEAVTAIAAKTNAEIIQVLGKTLLIFRANPDRHIDDRIKLPA